MNLDLQTYNNYTSLLKDYLAVYGMFDTRSGFT